MAQAWDDVDDVDLTTRKTPAPSVCRTVADADEQRAEPANKFESEEDSDSDDDLDEKPNGDLPLAEGPAEVYEGFDIGPPLKSEVDLRPCRVRIRLSLHAATS